MDRSSESMESPPMKTIRALTPKEDEMLKKRLQKLGYRASKRFTGPLFIVGMPRSGTKLLRDLIKQHPKIGIPSVETNFIPYMINLFGNPPSFEDDKEFNQFYKELGNMKLLKEIFPEAKFLHIIRDPRDVCLSKKKIWGSNLYRTAELWRLRVEIGQSDGYDLGDDYMELLYENLLEDPEQTMISVCAFLCCNFITAMTELSKPSEDYGGAKGQVRIVKENKNKYLLELSPSEIKRIEEITYPVTKTIPYNFEYDIEFKPLNPLTLKILTFYDGIALLIFYIREKGILQGFMHMYRNLKNI